MSYEKEVVFRFYGADIANILELFKRVQLSGFELISIVSDMEYFDKLDEVLKRDIDLGLIVNMSPKSHINISKVKSADLEESDSFIYNCSFYYQWSSSFENIIFEFMAESHGIDYAYLANYYDIKWQNQKSLDVYKVNKKSAKGLSFSTDIFDKKCIDISKNYGREVMYNGILFNASYCSWINLSHHNLRVKKTVSMDMFSDCVILSNKLIQVQLFESIFIDYSEVRNVQKEMLFKLGVID